MILALRCSIMIGRWTMPSAVFSHLAPSSRTLLNSDFASMHTFKLRVLIATRMHEKRESVDISSRSMVDSMLTTLLIECAQSSLTTDARDRVYACTVYLHLQVYICLIQTIPRRLHRFTRKQPPRSSSNLDR